MNIHDTRRATRVNDRERGAARINFLVVLLLIVVGCYSLTQYAPVAYQAFLYKDFMQDTINKATFIAPDQTTAWVEKQLRAGAGDFKMPHDMSVNVQNVNGHLEARVQWTQPIALPGYVYQYQFDHTARAAGFISSQ